MATKRIPKAERIGDAIRSLKIWSDSAARAQVYYWDAMDRANMGLDHCAHTVEFKRQEWLRVAERRDLARALLVNLTGAVV